MGRPPKGTGDLEALTIRMTWEQKELLKAVAQVMDVPAYELAARGVQMLLDSLPQEVIDDAREIIRLTGRARARLEAG